MDATRSYVRVYNIDAQSAKDFEFDYDTAGVEKSSSDILTELVPNLDHWGEIGWMEVLDYEYNLEGKTIHLLLETKSATPLRWLQQASNDVPYFKNKLITMSTIQHDDTRVTGTATIDGEILQNKTIWSMGTEEVAKYHDDDDDSQDLDNLDNQIWDSIQKFVNICEQYYMEEQGEKND